MLQKDNSLSKKEGWDAYSKRSWLLLPKFFGNALLSIIIYATLIFSIYTIYNNGGIEQSVKKLAFAYNGTGIKA
jgi:hypothetical protein